MNPGSVLDRKKKSYFVGKTVAVPDCRTPLQMFEGVDGRQWKVHSGSEAALEHMHCNPKVNVSFKSYINAHRVPVHHTGSQG